MGRRLRVPAHALLLCRAALPPRHSVPLRQVCDVGAVGCACLPLGAGSNAGEKEVEAITVLVDRMVQVRQSP